MVGAGEIIAGPFVRLACERHLRDIEEQEKRGLVWRKDLAEKALGFFPTVLRLAEGEHAGEPFELEPAQCFIVGSLFGWIGADGYRRFRTAYVEMGKGNGKSPLAAGIALKMMAADGEAGAECYAAAVTRDQAGIMFRDAELMVAASPALAKRIQSRHANLAMPTTASFFRPVSSEGKSLDGKRVHFAGIDEIHEHRTSIVVDKMRAGTKGRRQALIFEITNSGYDRNSVCWQHHEYSRRVVSGEVEDDSWFAYVCALDEGDDWRDPECWIKANPLLGVSITEKYLREQVREAEGMPAKQSLVRRLNFCEWTESHSPAIDQDRWRSCLAAFDLDDMMGAACEGGLDLSGKNDLTALTLAFEPIDGRTRAVTWFWAPADGMREREDRDAVPYSTWARQGHLSTTPGRSIDYRFVAEQLRRLSGLYDIRALAFDRWRIDDFLRACDDVGLEVWVEGKDKPGSGLKLVPHGQGFADMSPAVDALETAILNGALAVQDNPVMSMCAANAVYAFDPAGNRKFDKRPDKSTGRIDGMVSLAMAMRLAAKAMPDQTVDFNRMLIEQGERFVI